MIHAAVLDLDGTLIGRNEVISTEVGQAVSQVSEKVPVAIATGREAAHVVDFARQLGLTTPQISDGGAAILDPASGRFLWTSPLQPSLAREIITDLHGSETAFIATHPEGSSKSLARIDNQGIIRVSALDMDEQGADDVVARYRLTPELHMVKVFLPYNGLWAVDFTNAGVDKAAAVRVLAQMLGVDAPKMVAAGDSYNDLPMLRLCGHSIAMGDAPDELKAIADFVAPTAEEDGLAVAIREFVLPRL